MGSHDDCGSEDDGSVRFFCHEITGVLLVTDTSESDPATSVDFDEFWAGSHVAFLFQLRHCSEWRYQHYTPRNTPLQYPITPTCGKVIGVADMELSDDAEAALSTLQTDSRSEQLYERVNDVLDQIEDDPSAHAVRRRQYRDPPLWGVPVHGSGEDWLVLWHEDEPGTISVYYIGPDLV